MSKRIELWTSATCGPCQTMKKYLRDRTDLNVQYVNYEEQADLFLEENIRSVPLIRFYDSEDNLIFSQNGYMPEDKLQEVYESLT